MTLTDVPALDDCVPLPAGRYPVGEPGEERTVALAAVAVGRFPVTWAHWRSFALATGRPVTAAAAAPALRDHPATGVTLAEAAAFCAWAGARVGRRVRLLAPDEWEAAARGPQALTWPWGDTFDPERCNCAEAAWGWTTPVTAHPAGASPAGAEQLAGNVWEWVAGTGPDGWGTVRGGSHLDTAWGLRASRALPADPARATATTGFRIAIDPDPEAPRDDGPTP
jgi:formylglycine-generating enzyme required for sulfatase activity